MTVDVDLSDNFSSEARSKIFDNFFALKNARPIYSLCPFSCSQKLLLQLQQYTIVHDANYQKVQSKL